MMILQMTVILRKNRDRSFFGKKNNKEESFNDFDADEGKTFQPSASSKVTPMRPAAKHGGNMEVCVVKPTSVDDSREITETLLAGRTVILNLEGMDLEIAQRIIDFISGAAFAISGNLQKISSYIFLVTPTNVDISGDLQDLLSGSMETPSVRGRYQNLTSTIGTGFQNYYDKRKSEKETKLLEHRFIELSRIAFEREIVTYSDFLNLNDQNILHTLPKNKLYSRYVLFGGYDMAERQMAAFIPEALSLRYGVSDITPKEIDYPFCAVKIEPKNKRFSEDLTHRDFLGSILNLGIDRSKTGDILVTEDSALLFINKDLASVVTEDLTRVRHTVIDSSVINLDMINYTPDFQQIKGTVSSVRLDSLLPLAFSSSRSKLSGLIEGAKVFVNGKLITSNGYQVKEGDLIYWYADLGKVPVFEESRENH